MRNFQLILPFITGLMLGIAQCTSRLFLLKKNLTEGFLLGGITATLYLIAIVQWSKVLKSQASLSSPYASTRRFFRYVNNKFTKNTRGGRYFGTRYYWVRTNCCRKCTYQALNVLHAYVSTYITSPRRS